MGCYSNHLPRKIIKDHVLIFTPLCKHVLLLWILFVYILSFCAHFILFNGSIVLHYFFPPPLDLFITSYIYIYISTKFIPIGSLTSTGIDQNTWNIGVTVSVCILIQNFLAKVEQYSKLCLFLQLKKRIKIKMYNYNACVYLHKYYSKNAFCTMYK